MRDVYGELIACHRTYLDLDAQKARVDVQKMSLGPIAGGAIQLALAGEVLGLVEGIETALSAMQMSEMPVWAALSAGNMKKVVLPDCVREVVIWGDSGSAGVKAAQGAAALFTEEGKAVSLAYPPEPYSDFNDLLMKGVGHENQT